MEEKNLLLAFKAWPSPDKPVKEQPLVDDQFVVEWQIGPVDSGEEGSSRPQAKPASEEFIADWSIISPTLPSDTAVET